VTAGAQQLPILFLSPIAGVWADRVSRRRLLMLIQSLVFLGFFGTGLVVALTGALLRSVWRAGREP
jgi:MFS family permease